MSQIPEPKSPLPATQPVPYPHRRRVIVIVSVITVLIAAALTFQSSMNILNLPGLNPERSSVALWFYTLSAFNFITFVVLIFVLGRNILKLMRERGKQQIGAKFKTRLVLFSITISLLPLIFLFFFAYGLINRAVDKWLSKPAIKSLNDAVLLKDSYERGEVDRLDTVAGRIAERATKVDFPELGSKAWFDDQLSRTGNPRPIYLEVSRKGQQVHWSDSTFPAANQELVERIIDARAALPAERDAQESGTANSSENDKLLDRRTVLLGKHLLLIGRSMNNDTMVILVREVRPAAAEHVSAINQDQIDFRAFTQDLPRVRITFLLTLCWITLALLFVSTWFAMYTARGITEPLAALVGATTQVARGNLDYRVGGLAEGEFALLVASFNEMAVKLAANRDQIESSAVELKEINLMLDERRRYIETILQSLSTGVISLDHSDQLTTINDSAISLLQLPARPALGSPLAQFLSANNFQEITRLIRRARRSGIVNRQLELERLDGSTIPTSTSATTVKSADGKHQGVVIMIEDLTELIKAQRSVAWSEVAQRMAHEIKNPLTPIQLAAERIARRFEQENGSRRSSQLAPLVAEGTSTIIREVGTLKRMVDEFSRFARLPESQLAPNSLNEVVHNAVAMYAERSPNITVKEELDAGLPPLNLDPDQFKRVLINLLENSFESIVDPRCGNGSSDAKGQVLVETHYLAAEGKARLIVADTGHGISAEDKSKLFLPYFSTRRRGTGLGLAIVNHIVNEHNGRITAEENRPRGARFVVELPS